MIVIRCPYCKEERHEEELTFGGEAEIVRAIDPEKASDEEWTEYLYFRTNPKGVSSRTMVLFGRMWAVV